MKLSAISKSGWLLLTILVVVPFALWATTQPLSERFSTVYLSLTSVGRLVGIASMVLFSLNIILTARLKIVETLFGGLNKVYMAHHVIGGLALLVILLHPLVLAMRTMTVSPRDAALELLPLASDTMTTIGILSLWLFIALMVLTLYVKLPYKTWLLTHKFMGLVMLGIIVHIVLGANDINADIRLQVYSWWLMGLAVLAYLYRTILPRVLVRRYGYTVVAANVLPGGVVRFVMMPQKKAIRFQPGQFVFVSFLADGISREYHPFSISSNARTEGLTITVKALGEYTSRLVELAPSMVGFTAKVEGAYGRFNFENFPGKRQVWVGGGIGITPFLGMVSDVQAPYQVDLYYAVKSAGEIIDSEYLQQVIAASGGSLRVIPYVADTYGLLTGEKIQEYSGALGDVEVLLCGPPPMMHALKGQLTSLGVRASRIHSEEFAIL